MKYTNIKKLLIKFMGGGLINFPTRFLRWIKIDGDAEGDDSGNDGGGDSSSSDVFFVPATIQPKYFVNIDDTEPIEIENYTIGNSIFFYNKEDIISLGVNEEDLNNLNILSIEDMSNEIVNHSYINGLLIPKENFYDKVVLQGIEPGNRAFLYGMRDCYVYKISNNIFMIIEEPMQINPGDPGYSGIIS